MVIAISKKISQHRIDIGKIYQHRGMVYFFKKKLVI